MIINQFEDDTYMTIHQINGSFIAKDTTISDLLYNNNVFFRVPRFQRGYTWGQDQAEDFFDDLVQTNITSYFLGTIILNCQDSENSTGVASLDIIDGQQRLVTIIAFNAALRDVARHYDNGTASLIHRHDINAEFRDGSTRSRITPGESLETYFNKLIVEQSKQPDEDAVKLTDEQKQLKIVYNYFYEQIYNRVQSLEDYSDIIKELKSLRDRIANLRVIRVDIRNEDDAYEIFERTNARGIDLSVADLLKNVIFSKIRELDYKDDAKENWEEMLADINAARVPLNKYVRYYWMSRHKFVQEKQLFREVRSVTDDWGTFLYSLKSDAEIFRILMTDGVDSFERLGLKHYRDIYNSIFAVRSMGVSQCFVYFLSLLRNRNKFDNDLRHIFQLVEYFSFRYFTICKQPGNKVERLFAKYALQLEHVCAETNIVDTRIRISNDFKMLHTELIELNPTDEAFENAFLQFRVRNDTDSKRVVKYALNKINQSLAITDEHLIDFDKVNLEHILPQVPDKSAWNNLTKSLIKNYVHSFGNLVLLSNKLNSKIQNGSLNNKILEYKQSSLPIVKDLVDFIENYSDSAGQCPDQNYGWGEQQIGERHRLLAKRASTLWKV